MKTKLKPLLSSLAYVGSAIKTKTTLPILSHVKLEVDNGRLTLSGASLDVFMTSVIDCEGELAPCCIKHSALIAILSHALGEDVKMTLQGEDKLKIQVGKSITFLHVMSPEEFVPVPVEGKTVAVHSMILSDALRATHWAAADAKAGRPPMEYVTIDMTAKRLRCYAGNGYVMASFREQCICGDEVLMVHSDFCVTLANALMSKDAYLWASPRHIGVTTPAGMVVVKKSEHPRPAFEAVIKIVEKKAEGATLKLESLKQICSSVRALSDNPAEVPRIQIDIKNKLVSAVGKGNLGSQQDEFEWDGNYSATMILNANYIATALNHLKADKVTVHVTEAASVWNAGPLTLAISQLRTL